MISVDDEQSGGSEKPGAPSVAMLKSLSRHSRNRSFAPDRQKWEQACASRRALCSPRTREPHMLRPDLEPRARS